MFAATISIVLTLAYEGYLGFVVWTHPSIPFFAKGILLLNFTLLSLIGISKSIQYYAVQATGKGTR
jgi:hypothetical protein